MSDEEPRQRMTATRLYRAIRAKCMDCTCGQRSVVADCPCAHCSLYPHRFGMAIASRERRRERQYRADLTTRGQN